MEESFKNNLITKEDAKSIFNSLVNNKRDYFESNLINRIKFDLSISDDIYQIYNIFNKYNYKLYIVGGAVRDSLLGKPIKDYDLVTDALPDMVEKLMNDINFKTIGTGKAFGVINVFTDKSEYEIATMRSDGTYTDGRRPDSVTFGNIESDSKRRDLTINALFFDISTSEIVDLVGGIEDLKNGIIRTVGKAEDRFAEDKLRIIRMIRFAARFGSNLDSTADAALKVDSSLNGISSERIRDEFIKGVYSAKSVVHFLELLNKYDLFRYIFSGFTINKDFVEIRNIYVLIATLLKDNDTLTMEKKLLALSYKHKDNEIAKIVFLVSLQKLSIDTAVILKRKEKLANVSDLEIKEFVKFTSIDTKLINAFLKFTLTVTGPELMNKLNIPAGPELGKAILKVETENFTKLL